MPQLPLSLTLPTDYSEANFYVSTCNQEAYAWIMRWPDWPSHALYLYGPEGSGKTHLAHIWQARVPQGKLVEEVEAQAVEPLLHLYNSCKENQIPLLLTSRFAPAALPFTLPDLTSRLRATQAIAIAAPDDEVLAAAMRKQFSDRQLRVDDEVISYLLARSERSFASVRSLVGQLDAAALASHRTLTIPFVRTIIN